MSSGTDITTSETPVSVHDMELICVKKTKQDNTRSTTSDSALKDEELDAERDFFKPGTGLTGVVERIPLPVKLAILVALTTIGVVALTVGLIASEAVSLSVAANTDIYLHNVMPIDKFAKCVRAERNPSVVYLSYHRNVSNLPAVLDSYNCTVPDLAAVRALYPVYLDSAGSSRDETQRLINVVEDFVSRLNATRELVLGNDTDVVADAYYIREYYANFIEALLAVAGYYVGSMKNNSPGGLYLNLFRVTGSVARLRGAGDIVFIDGLDSKSYSHIYACSERLIVSESDFLSLATTDMYDQYQRQVSSLPETIRVLNWVASIVDGTAVNVTEDDWHSTTSAWVNALTAFEQQVLNGILDSSKQTVNQGIGIIFLVVCAPAAVLVASILFGTLFARTITGPWRRLNRLQQDTITKFVPSSFLSTIKCQSISEAEIGKHIQKETVILYTEMTTYWIAMKDAKPQDMIDILNSFFKVSIISL
jgi:hypothetical protein